MRVIIKGGVWKNTEDEILKAAVMKYGKNQWARISSLLVRKTPKQCKARWYEWLDPSIKKTEWSKEEDEKLLHLAKLMPTQWRTIAPIVGRTPSQCLERYQKLLDEAESSVAGLDLTTASNEAAPSADDIRRLRPGEIDPDPESKPARPDPVDMDEDEKEMLSEARARLANTQGKKAKRKAREKQLEEARRIAAIQKRRELKAAGIEVHEKKTKKGMDYNADIPFERKPYAGAYDTREEVNKEFLDPNFAKLQLQNVEPKKRHEIQEEQQKEYNKRQKILKEKQKEGLAPSAHLEQLAKQQFTANRRKLVLPAPQIGESELEEIVKMGMDSDSALALVQDEGSSITQGLLSEYRQTPSFNSQLRTPRTQTTVDTVLQEAQNQLAMTNAQTPLLGGDNDGLDRMDTGTGFDGATPRKAITSTPHPMVSTPSSTPGFKQPASVRRDNFGINSSVASTPLHEEKLTMSLLKQKLAVGLANLPAPKNDFVLVIPEEEEEEEDLEEAVLNEEDAAERDRRIQEQIEEEERTLLRQRSQVLKMGLPRPVEFDSAAYLEAAVENSVYSKADQPALFWADKLIQEELIRLLQYETEVYPPPADLVAALRSKRKSNAKFDLSSYHELDEDVLAEARDLIEEETQRRNLSTKDIEALVEPMISSNLVSLRSSKAVFEENMTNVLKLAAKAKKREKKLGILLGGYMARAKAHGKSIRDSYDQLDEVRIEHESIFSLHQQEHASGQIRLEKLTREVEALKKKEQEGQSKYAELSQVKYDLMQKLYPSQSNPTTNSH
ncbi:Pre-mRNA-splicing factor cef1 [Entomophthora muscae]|uniref:Pre-mRNA-splicing factor cef1 n=1 Tax=Entomophthora muscae TaxID=34485 RepID=A0ACC2URZ1_9FUNG|nr:Pre-mRNA-splicing factor cef1 [Entomophthora muscae]